MKSFIAIFLSALCFASNAWGQDYPDGRYVCRSESGRGEVAFIIRLKSEARQVKRIEFIDFKTSDDCNCRQYEELFFQSHMPYELSLIPDGMNMYELELMPGKIVNAKINRSPIPAYTMILIVRKPGLFWTYCSALEN